MSAVQERLEDVTKGGRKLTRRGRRNLQRQLRQLQKQTRQLQKQSAKRAKDVRGSLPGQSSGPLDTVRETASDVTGNIGKGLAVVGAATAARVAPLLGRSSGNGLTGQVKDTTKDLAGATRERTGDLAAQVTDTAKTLASATRERTGDLTELVKGTTKSLTGATRDRTGDLTERVRQDYVPQLVEAVVKAGSRVSEAASSGVSASRSALKDLADSDTLDDTRKVARRGGRRAAGTVGNVASATASGTKELAALLFWGAALGGIVYYGLLNDEQRAKVTGGATSLFEQGRELVRDFQGYDEEF